MKKAISVFLAMLIVLSVSPAAFADGQLFCRMCGSRIPADSRFCPFCGVSTAGTSSIPAGTAQSSGGTSQSAPSYGNDSYSSTVGAFVAAYEDMVKNTKYHRIAMKGAEASTERKATFIDIAENAIDDDPTTYWAEGISGHAYGESITIYLKNRSDISMIRFRMGNAYNDVSFAEHDRPKHITVLFSDGSSASGVFPDDNAKYVIAFDFPITAEWFTVVVDDIYEGSHGTDCCISEITPYAIG